MNEQTSRIIEEAVRRSGRDVPSISTVGRSSILDAFREHALRSGADAPKAQILHLTEHDLDQLERRGATISHDGQRFRIESMPPPLNTSKEERRRHRQRERDEHKRQERDRKAAARKGEDDAALRGIAERIHAADRDPERIVQGEELRRVQEAAEG